MALALRLSFWLVAGLFALLLLTQPVSVAAQGILGGAVIVLMLGVWIFLRGALARQLFFALATFVVIRYIYWRGAETLPPISDVTGFICGVILFGAELYCVVILTISLIINIEPLRRPKLERDADLPTVDIFIPTYNEDEYILATTVAAAKSMDYPADKLNVYLLDDGGTDQKCGDRNPEKAKAARERRASLQSLCAELGAHYRTRAKNEHAKAGNMNAQLPHTDGEIIVVFDADHAPFRAFLRETVGHFRRDPRLFLVQTPHVFLNPDPIEKNLRTFNAMPSENEMFYSMTQRGLDKWDGSFFCGSAALLRRAALLETGGFSGVTITEDCETAFELHSRGWHSVFVDKPLIAGLQPETFSSFIGQRSRWCQGMFQIMLLKNPTFKKGLKPIQRLAYLSSMTFWFFPVPRLIFMFAPLCYIFFDIKLFVANVNEALSYTLVYMIVNMMLQNYIYGRLRWPWVSELYEYVQGIFLAKAIVSVVASPRKPTFNVTAKGLSLDEDHLSELSWPFFAAWGLLLVAQFVALWRYAFDPGANGLMLVVSLWNGFNLMIAGAALGAVSERKQPDRHPRLGVDREGAAVIEGVRYPVRIKNVSAGGCAFVFTDAAPESLAIRSVRGRLYVRPMPAARHPRQSLPFHILRETTSPDEALVGAQFDDMRPRDYFALAELMYGDSDALPRFLRSRRSHKNLLAGSGQFIWWGLSEPVRAIRYAVRDWLPEIARKAVPEPEPEPRTATEIADVSVAGLRNLLDLAAAQMRDATAQAVQTAKKA
ncbi:UDP-forming cellulose synthase catalytic subunit [Rhodoblastus acidophilus]|uniref:Cellulose synthase catalytic subunit [UDP-forming] n=1 Tax=Candidatus Rhodoblastus alkanivorans TaxID=2954117 RepID=A0ABS9Z603_9HYPH|nr:UDP-forming cellulose synthase catalytic subunit [Candidatus Rhodoblastus alkanivorans]MCI4678431.1 UDP-forming cellulose synthase catalytic subunit [Candidatus Rhodoblastus alkanivorans]MCI4682896.1 UDP-forming cellulose synthase catalytic subunit [Candidatus Rhodoblastus alkanivorans]MDI4640205.1 UDP-forming cellulose synthase catalytic subunit [Rhodoblastus acidophilus]